MDYKKLFFTLLEQDEAEAVASEEEAGKKALEAEIEPTTNPDDLGAQNVPVDIAAAKSQNLIQQKQLLKTWVDEIEKFVVYINGEEGGSIQKTLAGASCDSLFEKVASSEHKRIARVAVELSALAEALRGYLITGDEG